MFLWFPQKKSPMKRIALPNECLFFVNFKGFHSFFIQGGSSGGDIGAAGGRRDAEGVVDPMMDNVAPEVGPKEGA